MNQKELPVEKNAFLAIVGRPNVGKSSLLNALLGQKLAIVSSKPQTTRTRIMGVLTRGEYQYVFIDTPGLHPSHNRLDDYMTKSIASSVAGVDAAILVTEAGAEIAPAERELIASIRSQHLPAILVINKIDRLAQKEKLMAQIAAYSREYDFEAVVPLSALTGDGIGDLFAEIAPLAQEGPHMFDEDELTDMPEKTLAGEMVREKALRLLQKEVPHGIAVAVERMTERGDGLLEIGATIYCERESHKGIIIGKQGAMLKKIGSYAREDLEKFFGCRVNLQLWVKVKEDWRNRDALLRSFGYDKNNFEDFGE